MPKECLEILKAARGEEMVGNLSKAAELYYKASICFAMYNEPGEYESLRRKSGELFLAATRDEPNPAFAIKYGILAHKNLVEFDGKLATECYNMLLYLITNNLERLLTDKEACMLAAEFLTDQGMVELAANLYLCLARECEKEGLVQLTATLYSNAAASKEGGDDLRGSAECNEIAGKFFMACGLHLEAVQHFIKSFLERILLGEVDDVILKLSDEACSKGNIEDVWHVELISLCRDLSRGYVDSARNKWLLMRRKFKPSFGLLVERAIEKVSKERQGLGLQQR